MDIREVKIEEYWPLIVKGTEEFGQIAAAENPEFNILAGHVYDVLKDSFIKEATEYGVSRWEKMLGLNVTDDMTIEDRRAAILTHLTINLPYTWRVLKQMLINLLGEDNFEMSLDNDTQTLTISISNDVVSKLDQVKELSNRVIPQNLVIEYDSYPLPIGYTRLDYLQGAGKQYINTQATGNETSEVLCTFERTSADNKAVYTQNTKASTGGLNCFVWGLAMKHLRYDWGSKNYGNKNAYPGGMVTSVQSAAGATLNGVKIIEFDAAEEFTSAHLVLFSNRATIGAWTADNVRMARWVLKTDGKLVRDMLPALDPTGAPCMYDLVTRTPYYNDSKVGDFAYPNMEQQSTTYSLRRRDYAQITEHGIRRLYHVPKGCELSKEEYAEQNGFKLLIETPAPEAGYWVPKLTETADAIIIEWAETEPPTEEGIEND